MEIMFFHHELEKAVQTFAEQMKTIRCFAFHGDMGAGKTTFITALCKQLGVEDAMSSPTFSLINEYHTKEGTLIYHMDLYRLKSEQEAMHAGIEDTLHSGNICLVEWPEKAPGIFPEDTLHCRLTIATDGSRKLHFIS